MQKRSLFSILLAALLLLGVTTSCAPSSGGEQTGEQYIDPVYPPYYETVYQELFGADFDTVVEKLGYTREDFVLVEDPIPGFYRTEKTVTYLDQEFQVELWFYDGEAATALGAVALYKELPGTPQEQAKLAVDTGETIKKMFGHHTKKRDEELEAWFVLDEALFESWFTGTESQNRSIIFYLTDKVDHIPITAMPARIQLNSEHRRGLPVHVQLNYGVYYHPTLEEPTFIRISYQTGIVSATEFVRE